MHVPLGKYHVKPLKGRVTRSPSWERSREAGLVTKPSLAHLSTQLLCTPTTTTTKTPAVCVCTAQDRTFNPRVERAPVEEEVALPTRLTTRRIREWGRLGPIRTHNRMGGIITPHRRPGDLPQDIPPPVGLGLPHHQADSGPLNQPHSLVANGQPPDYPSSRHGQTKWRWTMRIALCPNKDRRVVMKARQGTE